MTTRGEINSNFYQIVNVDANGAPTSIKPAYIQGGNSTNANYANYAGNAFSVSVGNVAGIGNIATVNLTGNGQQVLLGNGNWGLNGGAVSNYANYAGNVVNGSQPNITSVGTLGSLSVTNTVTAGNVTTPTVYDPGLALQGYDFVQMQYSNATTLPVDHYDIGTGSWFYLDGGGATFQSNTTGTLKQVVIGNNGNINADGNVTAPYFIGNGSSLTSLTGGNVTGSVAQSNYANIANSVAVANVVGIGNIATVNLTGSDTQVLYGNGVFTTLTLPSGSGISNGTSNVNIPTSGGNINSSVGGTPNVFVVTGTGANVQGTFNATGNITANNLTISNLSSFSGNMNMNFNWINNVGYPVANADAATKEYVDITASSGLTFHAAVYVATTVNVTAVAYNQPGGAGVGVGATLTRTSSFATLQIDGVVVPLNARVLVRLQTTQQWNGVYTVTDTGSPSTAWILTRATDADTYGSGPNQLSLNDYFFVQNGTTQKGIAYVLNSPTGAIVFGTSAITFAEFSTSQVYTGGTGINIDGTIINISNTTVANGSYGNGDRVATFTVNDQGQLTAASNSVITSNAANLTGTTLNSSIVTSSLTSVGTLTSLNVSGQLTSTSTGNASDGGGQLFLNGSGNNRIDFNTNGTGAPTDTTRSSGTKITLYPALSGTQTDYAIGIDAATMWSSVPVNSSSFKFKWYGNTTEIANLDGAGNFTVTGNITGVNANLGNLATANYFSGNGYLLTGITSTTGNANYANFAGTVVNASQSNITSLGTLTGLNVSSSINANSFTSNVATGTAPFTVTSTTQVGNLTVAFANVANTANAVAGSNVSGSVAQSNYANIANSVAGGNVSGQVANALVAGTVYTAAQGNITSVGSLTGLTVSNATGVVDFTTTANVTLGAVANLHISGGTSGYVLQTDGAGVLSWVAQSGSGGSIISNGTSNVSIPASSGNVNINVNGTGIATFTSSNLNVNGNIIGSNSLGIYGNGGAMTGNITVTNYYSSISYNLGFAQARGTRGSAAAIQAGDPIVNFTGIGYTGNGTTTWDGITGWKTVTPFLSTVTAQPTGANGYFGSNVRLQSSSSSGNTNYIYTFDDTGGLTVPGNLTIGNIASTGLGNVANVLFTKYNETVVAGGSTGAATLTPNAAAGTIYNYTLTGNITLSALTNAVAGTGMTIILTQDGTGNRTLTSTMKFLGGSKTLSTAASAIDIMSVFYDGTTYYASLGKGFA